MSLFDDMFRNLYGSSALGQQQMSQNEAQRRAGLQNQLMGPAPSQQLANMSAEKIRQMMEAYDVMAATPEKKVKEKVKKALEDLDVYYAMPFTAGYGNSGVPDFLVCIEGRFFGIECKAGKNTTTALQDKHLSDIRAAGGVSLVIDETNVDKVKELILAKLGDK